MTSMTDTAPVPASRTTEGAARRTRPPQRGMILGMVAWLIGWIAATSLICFIFSWNGLLFARVLTGTVVQTGPVFLTGFVASLGLFLAKVCAAAFVVSLPVIIAGFATQDKLVQASPSAPSSSSGGQRWPPERRPARSLHDRSYR